MIHDEIAAFAAALPARGPVAGLDLGTRTIGVALSDLRRGVASPIEVIRREKFTADAARLLALLAARGAVGMILGLPLNMDGSEGPRAQSTRAFARNLSRLSPLPIGYWDERLSTVAAERALLEADTSRKRRKEVIDQVAAGYILQGALDRMAHIARLAPDAGPGFPPVGDDNAEDRP
jgi:putative Holliday junction resolvase